MEEIIDLNIHNISIDTILLFESCDYGDISYIYKGTTHIFEDEEYIDNNIDNNVEIIIKHKFVPLDTVEHVTRFYEKLTDILENNPKHIISKEYYHDGSNYNIYNPQNLTCYNFYVPPNKDITIVDINLVKFTRYIVREINNPTNRLPPIKINVDENGSYHLIDGNHRLDYSLYMEYSGIPAIIEFVQSNNNQKKRKIDETF